MSGSLVFRFLKLPYVSKEIFFFLKLELAQRNDRLVLFECTELPCWYTCKAMIWISSGRSCFSELWLPPILSVLSLKNRLFSQVVLGSKGVQRHLEEWGVSAWEQMGPLRSDWAESKWNGCPERSCFPDVQGIEEVCEGTRELREDFARSIWWVSIILPFYFFWEYLLSGQNGGCREDVFPRLGQSEDFRMHFELGTSQKSLTSSLRGNLGVVNCGATSGFVEKIGPRDEIQTPLRWKQGCRKTAERQDRESVCIQLLGTSTLLLLLQLVWLEFLSLTTQKVLFSTKQKLPAHSWVARSSVLVNSNMLRGEEIKWVPEPWESGG